MQQVETNIHDVVVIGAGAAGLFAAARSAAQGARTLLLEKNRRPGVKILMSGGTRCNLTNARGLRRPEAASGGVDPGFDTKLCRGFRAILQAFGAAGPFLTPALRALDVDATVARFEQLGVPVKIEANGKIFPVSDRAIQVLDALVSWTQHAQVELRTSTPVAAIEPLARSGEADPAFQVATGTGAVLARTVILAVGGASYPGCGTTGDGYGFARALGHTVIEPRPALAPLTVDAGWIKALKGIALEASARVVDPSGKILAARQEAVLFTHFGLSGPAILDVSRAVGATAEELTLELDLLPGMNAEALDLHIQTHARKGNQSAHMLIPQAIPRRLAEQLVVAAGIPGSRTGPDLSRLERMRLVSMIKKLRLGVTGTMGFAKAEVTTGGVALEEVDPTTLESLRAPGLFLAGEILDLDGPIGGYNFQAAWSTGWLAGQSACERARGKVQSLASRQGWQAPA